ncbi:MAG: hypothetical protein RQ729_07330 [Wenzhouxiangellaceae bacterium]|nr:hypothetical protein [Wenzhouxiangellaceae bacterium]
MTASTLVLLRTPPPPAGPAWPTLARARRVFAHADAVDWAVADVRLAAELEVCSSSWQRRHGDSRPPPPARLASLAQLTEAVLAGTSIRSLGFGGDGGRSGGVPGRLLLEVGFTPVDDRQRRETLEIALAAAAFELDGDVVFTGPGVAHLAGDGARGWGQLVDFGLLGLWADSALPDAVVAASPLPDDRLAALRSAAATRLLL